MCRSPPPTKGAVRVSGFPPRSSPRALTSRLRLPRCTFAVGSTSSFVAVSVRYARKPYQDAMPTAAQIATAVIALRHRFVLFLEATGRGGGPGRIGGAGVTGDS